MPVLIAAIEDWCCPNCLTADRTVGLPPHSARMHTCPGLHMLTAPLVRAGISAMVTAEVREDYLNGDEQATGDDGKPYMAVRTTFSDHDDVLVNAGIARGSLR